MKKTGLMAAALAAAVLAVPAAAQTAESRISVMPYVGYGFYGTLGDDGPRLSEDIAIGGRAAYQLTPQWGLYGNFQRSTPAVNDGEDATVDHWSAGVEFSYFPRGGAEGIIPLMLEAGVGQVRYDFPGGTKVNDLAGSIGISSALAVSRGLSVRWGVNDYISNFDGDGGLTNQIFAQVGAELRF